MAFYQSFFNTVSRRAGRFLKLKNSLMTQPLCLSNCPDIQIRRCIIQFTTDNHSSSIRNVRRVILWNGKLSPVILRHWASILVLVIRYCWHLSMTKNSSISLGLIRCNRQVSICITLIPDHDALKWLKNGFLIYRELIAHNIERRYCLKLSKIHPKGPLAVKDEYEVRENLQLAKYDILSSITENRDKSNSRLHAQSGSERTKKNI